MIVLATNVVSEAMRPTPSPAVLDWMDRQAAETLYLSSVTIAELLYGVGALPAGRRKQTLLSAVDGLIELFHDRVLPFNLEAARCYADLAVTARMGGKGFPTPDGYIAAIAVANGFTVATRDAGPFQAAGIDIIDPWTC
ncbi:type II toxin-antitoxin system VapC family toxin [Stenotrophomonas sp. SORGH_AS_0321]|uniref:type II toxin-antitoxin system VapC family toxin n=1 Tax=Stenotrophomonas sp. SORGH_AS_0321 TaxID=3041787 RepID=UPI002854CF9F|nr:type II toxin-antitoxin system VapC family toxin [Stenotrophomonas sp. SORGH_AS_0321]MDR6094680.1 putative nucleic acid-binding protein [Stenotrophomonas sp. SORGH_AS_0321]